MMSSDGDYEPDHSLEKELAQFATKPEVIMCHHHWYCSNRGATKDFYIGAQKSADTTGELQTIHFHSIDEECDGFDHDTVSPDPRRRAALTR